MEKKTNKKKPQVKKQPKKVVTNETVNTVYVENDSNGMAIAGFVCSFFIPLLGFIFGGIGLSKSFSLKNQNGRGFAIAAIVISAVQFIVSLIILLTQI